jgi:MFS family permease
MTVLVLTAAAVTLAAAVRSTWSPCGLSMLSTITPLAERAKGHSYRATAGWFVAGAVAGGGTLGGLMALAAAGVGAFHLSEDGLVAVALLAAAIAAASDSGVVGVRLPVHRRQVNERWLDRYRPWVYGAGFGWQIGTGLATYITTAAVYLMIVLGALTARPATAFGLGVAFGTLRGLAVLLTRNLTDPASLRSFHRRFDGALPTANRSVVAAEVAGSLALAIALGSPAAVAAVGAATAVAVAVASRGRRALARSQ